MFTLFASILTRLWGFINHLITYSLT